MKFNGNICVCGGGSSSLAITSLITNKNYKVNILTRKPDKWEKICGRTEPDSKYFVRD